jgi:penicillin-binding protein 2
MHKYEERGRILVIIAAAVVLVFILRLLYIQILDSDYKQFAENNALRKTVIYPARGLIYDRNGKILVRNETIFDVMVVPARVKDLDTTAICQLLEVDRQDFIDAFHKAKMYSRYKPSPVVRQLTSAQYGRFEERLFEFSGFFVQPRTMRYYPQKSAAHVLGYLGEVDSSIIDHDNEGYYRNGDYIGQSGLEKTYEKLLRGSKGYRNVLVDVQGREQGSYLNGKYDIPSVAGEELHTGLDLDLQLYAEKLMNGKRGTVVAIEPSTGQILTFLSAPFYDPNLLVGRDRAKNYLKLLRDKEKPLYNRALSARYRPGSIFKLVQSLCALQMGAITINTGFPCNKSIIGCHHHPDATNIIQAIQYSCNPYFYQVYKREIQAGTSSNIYEDSENGLRKWHDYVLSFGFGQKLDIDLPNMNTGFVPEVSFYDKWYGHHRWAFSTIYSNSIGEGELGAVPLQMANLAAIVANRGFYYTPHFVTGVGRNEKPLGQYIEKHYTKVNNQEYYENVIEGMQMVVEAGTARGARIKDIIVCGKTGTVQNVNAEDHSVFIAFAPKDSPKIAIAVYVENAGWGGSWAAPIASLLMEKYLKDTISRPAVEKKMLEASYQFSSQYPGGPHGDQHKVDSIKNVIALRNSEKNDDARKKTVMPPKKDDAIINERED